MDGTSIGYSSAMRGSSALLEHLARDVVQIADPETALRALTALRQELDATEPEIVRRALQAGASWSQIARALGVTKQAAHRKYRHLFEQAWGEGTAEPRPLVAGEARRSLRFARDEAKRLGQPVVGTEHILLGILRCPDSHAAKALGAEGITLAAARTCLQPTLAGVPPGALAAPQQDDEPVTLPARRVLEGSRREALRRGDGYIGVEHLLLALLLDSRNGGVQTLEQLRTTPARIRRQLDLIWTTPIAGPPAADDVDAVHVTSRNRPVSTS